MLNVPLFATQIFELEECGITILSFDVPVCVMFQSRSGYNISPRQEGVPVYLAILDLHHAFPVMLNWDP